MSAQAASAQLARLSKAGLIGVERSGRHRYYHLASDRVAIVIEALAALAPPLPVRSLRERTRAAALRRARTCYDHLAGRYGCAVTQGLLDRGVLVADDGIADTRRRATTRCRRSCTSTPTSSARPPVPSSPSSGSTSTPYAAGARRPLLRFCLDWSEQRHHLSGRLGAAVLDAFLEQRWVERRSGHRAVTVTDAGEAALTGWPASAGGRWQRAAVSRQPPPAPTAQRHVAG